METILTLTMYCKLYMDFPVVIYYWLKEINNIFIINSRNFTVTKSYLRHTFLRYFIV